jgi:hypothetical protein
MSTIVFTPAAGAALVFDNAASPPSWGWDAFREEPAGPRLREFSYPGIDGADAVLLGAAPREFVQIGRLFAAGAAALGAMQAALRAAANGVAGTLSVRGGAQSFANTLLLAVRFTDGGSDAAAHWARYELRWRQLVP